ncbi:MAG: glycosyltransferase family 4 protein [Anaerolineae bacterium]
MRILFILPHFTPDLGPLAPIYHALGEDLIERGHEATVVTAFPYYGEGEIWGEYKGKVFGIEEVDGMRVIRTYVYVAPKGKLLGRSLSYLTFHLLATVASLFLAGRHDAIVAPSPSIQIGLPLYLTSLLFGTPFIYNVQDLYPHVGVEAGVFKNKWLVGALKRLEGMLLGRARYVVVIADNFGRELVRRGVPPDKIITIPNCVDADFIRPLPRLNGFREKYQLGDKFVVMYAGNVGLSQGLETLLQCAQMFTEDGILFVIVGEGASLPSLKQRVLEMKLDNVQFIPYQPREDVPFVLAAADISLVLLRSGIASHSVPSKAFSIMASSRPIVAAVDRPSEIADIIGEARCGLLVEPENPEQLAKAISDLYYSESLRDELARNGRHYVERHYSRSVASNKYAQLLERIEQ